MVNLTGDFVRTGEFLLGPGGTIYRIPPTRISREVQKDPRVAIIVSGEDENMPLVIPDLDTNGGES